MGSIQSISVKYSDRDDSINPPKASNDSHVVLSTAANHDYDTSATLTKPVINTNIKTTGDESGYVKAQRKCRKKKLAYDACYTAQLSGKGEECHQWFDAYRACFLRVMTQDMENRGVKVQAGSMIGEYKEEIEGDEGEGNKR